MRFSEYVNYLQRVEDLSSRNEITVVISELINNLTIDEFEAAFYLMQGRVAPLYVDLEFNFSTKLLIKELSKSFPEVGLLLKETGDLGIAVEGLVSLPPSDFSLVEIHESLKFLAKLSGKNSQSAKAEKFEEMFFKMSGLEAKFFVRIIVGKLRLGVSDKTLLDSLSFALKGNKSLKPLLEKAYGVSADLPRIAKTLFEEGERAVENISLIPGVPLASKLVEREKDIEKIYDRLSGKLIIQPKYDGLRMQIHFNRGGFGDESSSNVRLFSRNMGTLTDMFPEVIEEIQKLPVESIIIDSEVIGFDPKTGKMLPFQETISRKRKHGVKEKLGKVPVIVHCFDLLLLDGENLLEKKLEFRLNRLKEVLSKYGGEEIVFAESLVLTSVEEMKEKFNEYKDAGLEGLIAKGLGSPYEPGTRNYDWIKLKVRAQEELADSVDAVVLGYYKGRGQRARFGIGAILAGVYDEDEERFISVAKVGTGFKDSDWNGLRTRLDKLSVNKIPDNVKIEKALIPDVFCFPEIVVVIEADEVSKSKVHGGGAGYSLRFPRFKQIRSDKSAIQATTTKEVEKLYRFNENGK